MTVRSVVMSLEWNMGRKNVTGGATKNTTRLLRFFLSYSSLVVSVLTPLAQSESIRARETARKGHEA